MATFIGTAAAVSQIDDFTPANVESTDDFTLTLTLENGATVAVTFTATATTVANVTAGLTAAWNANPAANQLATATDQTTKMRLTATTSGQPFSVAATTTDHGGANTQTLTRAAVTASAGPYDYGCKGNWAEGAVPIATNNVVILSGSILYGLNQSGVAINNFTIAPTHSGSIGSAGARLKIDPDGFLASGTGTYWLDIGTANIATRITRTASVAQGSFGMNIIGSNITTFTVESGSVAVATLLGETSTIATAQLWDGSLALGVGVSLTTWQQQKGIGELNCAATTVTADSGILTIKGVGAITTLNNNGATIYSSSTGTIGALNQNGGITDFLQNTASRTVTASTCKAGSIRTDSAYMIYTAKPAPSGHQTITFLAAS